jgi:hypothetical protein
MPLKKQIQSISYIAVFLNLFVSARQINFGAAVHKWFIQASRASDWCIWEEQ